MLVNVYHPLINSDYLSASNFSTRYTEFQMEVSAGQLLKVVACFARSPRGGAGPPSASNRALFRGFPPWDFTSVITVNYRDYVPSFSFVNC